MARWEELKSWELEEKRHGCEEEGVHVHWGLGVGILILGFWIQSCLTVRVLISGSCESHVGLIVVEVHEEGLMWKHHLRNVGWLFYILI